MSRSVEEIMDEIGPRIRKLRKEKGITSARMLSDYTGVSVNVILSIESGNIDYYRISVRDLITIAKFLCVGIEDIVVIKEVS